MKKFEAIIEQLSEEEAKRKKYDATERKLVTINDKTGKVSTGFFDAWGATFSYYLVSNSNLVERAIYESPKFIIEDRNGRKIDLFVKCEISCPPGNEERVAEALYATGKLPSVKFDGFIKRCINKFRNDDEHFIDNFFASNIVRQIEDFIVGQTVETPDGKTLHITGLVFHSVKCGTPDPDWVSIKLNLKDLKVGFQDSVERHLIFLDCNLAIHGENEINARLRNISPSDFEEIIRKAVPEIFDQFISEESIYDNFENVVNTLKTHLNARLQKYGREIKA